MTDSEIPAAMRHLVATEIDKTRASVAAMITAYRTRRAISGTTDEIAITKLAAVAFRQGWTPAESASILALTIALLSDATAATTPTIVVADTAAGRLPKTKADLYAAMNHLSDHTLVGIAGQHGELLEMELDYGFVTQLDGHTTPYIMFSPIPDDEDTDSD
jgi:hypothetical protein